MTFFSGNIFVSLCEHALRPFDL